MEDVVQLHKDLTAKINAVLKDFHGKYRSLAVSDVHIDYVETLDGNRKFLNVRLKILVQPN